MADLIIFGTIGALVVGGFWHANKRINGRDSEIEELERKIEQEAAKTGGLVNKEILDLYEQKLELTFGLKRRAKFN